MKRWFRIIVLPVLILLTAVTAPAQEQAAPFWPVMTADEMAVSPSPEVATLPAYRDPEVDLSSGRGTLSFGLLEWTVGNYPVRLGLTYRIGAFRTDELPGWIGLGWNLTGAGAVTRTVMGQPDESTEFDLRDYQDIDVDYLEDLLTYRAESNYDRYNYSFPGATGSFIIKNGHIIQLPESPNRIEQIGEEYEGVRDFRITTPDGTRYEFTEREHVEYHYLPYSLYVGLKIPDYHAVTSWQLSRIITSEGADTIHFHYDCVPRWSRSHDRPSQTLSTRNDPWSEKKLFWMSQSATDDGISVNATTFEDQRIISRITSRSGQAVFEHDTSEPFKKYISGVSLYNADGTLVRRASLNGDHSARRKLLGITLSGGDGVETASHKFVYHSDNIHRFGDYFNYPNAPANAPWTQHTFLDPQTLAPNARRRPDFKYATAGTLKQTTSATGLVTDFVYEPNTITFKRQSTLKVARGLVTIDTLTHSLINPDKPFPDLDSIPQAEPQEPVASDTSITIGIRIKSITQTDRTTGRNRIRSFDYSKGIASIDFSQISISDYISLSGLEWFYMPNPASVLIITVDDISSTLLYSSRLPGQSPENARIYYGKVKETVSGSDLEHPVVTEYDYDLSRCQSKRIGAGREMSQESTVDNNRSLCPVFVPTGGSDADRERFQSHIVRGYFPEHIGAEPELRKTTVYRWGNGGYSPERTEERFYITTDSSCLTTGMHHEMLVRQVRTYPQEVVKNDLHSVKDMSYFNVATLASTRTLDSIATTQYFSDGSTRTKYTKLHYSGIKLNRQQIPKPGVSLDIIGPDTSDQTLVRLPESPWNTDSIHSRSDILLPTGETVREGRHRLERHVVYAATTDTEFFREAVGRGLQTLPVAEMWVMDGCDTLMRRYEYGRFAATGGVTLTRPTAIITGIPGQDAADVQRVTGGYSGYGRPLAVSQTARPTATYEWGCGGDLLTALTMGGGDDATGLRSEFDYEPLVGCTEIRFPSGRTATYGYSGGRLATVTDTYGKILTRHEYETFGETDGLTGRNRITTTTYPAGGSQGSVATRRFDGFGQTVAEVAEGAGNGGEDVATVVRYDALGRPVRQWLPLPLTSASAESDATLADALRRDVALTSAAMERYGDTQAYSVMTYPEGSASELAATATLGGEAFAGHPSRQELTCSNPSDRERRVVRWSWDGTALSASGYYGAGELTAVRTEDGDGRVTYVFTDCLGRTVLQRSLADGGKQADTYTVSDPWGNPLIVLPPELSARLGDTGQNLPGSAQMAELIDQYAFVYSYDHQLRMRSKKLPGCGAVRYAYDCDGRLAFTRDGNQEQQGRRSFMLYDRQGRVAVTGVCRDALDEAFWSAPSSVNPSMTATMTGACGASGTLCGSGYSVGAELTDPLAEAQLLTATYYDDYSFIPQDKASDIRQHRPSTAITAPRGLNTGALTAQLGADGIGRGLLSVTYYDREERPLVTVGETPTGELLVSTTAYNAGGQPTQTEYTLQKNGDALTTRATFGYDRHGRLTRTQQTLVPQTAASTAAAAATLPDGPISGPRPPRPPQPVTVAVSTSGYDALGRLSRTTTSRMPGMAGLTRTNEYDMHGWMEKWYCGFVEQQLAYADGAMPSYTGRISSKTTTYGGETRRYDYSYDMLGRLVGADYSGVDLANGGAALAADYSTAYSYDLQGNILTLTRQGLIAPDLYGQIDDLTATLRGNQLVGLRDDADDVLLESSLDLRGGDFGEDAFGYDRNGNQTRDMSRGVADVTYNVLNLPQRMEMEDGSAISYTYSASGAKLTETVISPDGNRVTARMYKGPFEVRLDSIMTPNGLSILVPRDTMIHLADGYLTMADTVFHAYIADYQGNITGVYNTRTAALEQFTDYYPYGMPHAMAVASNCGNRRKFGGKELTTDRGLNLYYVEARFHNPGYPMFTTPDPLGEKTRSVSLYIFCNGDPINYVDPTGMFSWENFINGLLKTICGSFEAAAGASLCSTGSGAFIGVPALVHGCDVMVAGINQMVQDEDTSTMTSQAIQQAGVPKETADLVDNAISVATGTGAAVKMATAEKAALSVSDDAVSAAAFTDSPGTNAVTQSNKIGATGAIGEARLAAEHPGIPHKYFPTEFGARYVDIYETSTETAHEAKVGYTTLTKFVRSQINKDAYLLQNGEVKHVTWHFYVSSETGRIGPSIPLQNELNRVGFKVVIHY